MAATLMQSPAHRPSMDHVASFDRSRPSSTVGAPFASPGYDRAPSPAGAPRSRTNSSTSASPNPPAMNTVGPFPQQPYGVQGYYPQFPMHHQQGWGPAPQANAFYSASFQAHAAYSNGAPQFQPGAFQGGPADFSAWAHVYQQMVAGGHMPAPGHMPPPPPHQDIDDMSPVESPRPRTSSAPRPSTSTTPTSARAPQAPAPFHPYQRGPRHRSNNSRERAEMPRNSSAPSTPISLDGLARLPPQQRGGSPAEGHRRVASGTSQSSGGAGDFAPPPKLRDNRRPSSVHSRSSSRSHDSNSARSPNGGNSLAGPSRASPPVSGSVSPAGPSSAAPSVKSSSSRPPTESTGNAINAASARSPLSQTKPLIQTSQPVVEKQTAGIMGHFKAKGKDKASSPVSKDSISQPSPIRAESSTSARLGSSTNAPFVNVQAMGSDVSLAETERTAATTASAAGIKPKRSLFRIRNKSSDNISLSSTVSSASMMIRKMGSIGKLARRNSLMGISKIFKDKAKDEDAPVPEKQGVFGGFRKKNSKKAEAAPAAVSRSTAEIDRMGDDDQVIAGLSPAAQLARQHTARSKARAQEAQRRGTTASAAPQAGSISEMGAATGEPTWDSNTTTRNTQNAAVPRPQSTASNGPSVLQIVPRSEGPTVVQAVQYNAGDVDSIHSVDDTVEDLTASMNQASLQDDDFQPLWTHPYVDYNARPTKGILKQTVSNENMEDQVLRQRSSSTSQAVIPQIQGPLSSMPAPLPEKIDGAIHASHSNPGQASAAAEASNSAEAEETLDGAKTYDPLSPDFSPFDSSPIELDLKPPTIYSQPAHNTSAPSLPSGAMPVPHRSMTAPIRRRLVWASECAVYCTYDGATYDRRAEPATCNRLTPELAAAIKQELNEFKLEMPVHPSSRVYTHYFA